MRHLFGLVGMIVGGLIGLAIYFVPTVVASLRNHRNVLAIAIVNLLFGWSCIGWVVALIWALA